MNLTEDIFYEDYLLEQEAERLRPNNEAEVQAYFTVLAASRGDRESRNLILAAHKKSLKDPTNFPLHPYYKNFIFDSTTLLENDSEASPYTKADFKDAKGALIYETVAFFTKRLKNNTPPLTNQYDEALNLTGELYTITPETVRRYISAGKKSRLKLRDFIRVDIHSDKAKNITALSDTELTMHVLKACGELMHKKLLRLYDWYV